MDCDGDDSSMTPGVKRQVDGGGNDGSMTPGVLRQVEGSGKDQGCRDLYPVKGRKTRKPLTATFARYCCAQPHQKVLD